MREMVPHLFVRIPIRRVFGEPKHVKSVLRVNVGLGLLGGMWWRLIHHNYRVTSGMMAEHLSQEIDYFVGCDSLLMQSKDQLATMRDGRHCRYSSARACHTLLRRAAHEPPRLTQQRRQRNVRFVLEVENCPVFPDRAANPRQFATSPFGSLFLGQLKILSLGLLIAQPSLVQSPQHRPFGQDNTELTSNYLDQSACRPKVGFIPKRGSRSQYHVHQSVRIEARKLSWTPRNRLSLQAGFPVSLKPLQPAMNRRTIRAVRLGDVCDHHAAINHCTNGPNPEIIRRIHRQLWRSFAHTRELSPIS